MKSVKSVVFLRLRRFRAGLICVNLWLASSSSASRPDAPNKFFVRKRLNGATVQVMIPLDGFFVRDFKAIGRESLEQTQHQPGAQRFRQGCRLILNLFYVHDPNIANSTTCGKSDQIRLLSGSKVEARHLHGVAHQNFPRSHGRVIPRLPLDGLEARQLLVAVGAGLDQCQFTLSA